MAKTPSAHFVPESLRLRVPYTDAPFIEQYDPHEISLGNGRREIQHVLEIIYDPQSNRPAKTKALRLLVDLLPGREEEAIQLDAFEVLRPLLLQPPNSILLYTLIALEKLISTPDHACVLIDDIKRIVEILNPEVEIPLRVAAGSLLRHMAELTGPIEAYFKDDLPSQIVTAAASEFTTKPLLTELFRLLSRLTNHQKVRIPIIENDSLLEKIVKSVTDAELRTGALDLANNVAMDSSHNGKRALLDHDILDVLSPLLEAKEISLRMPVLSLMSMLAVPKEGKERIAMSRCIADSLKRISETDADLGCRRAAQKCRIFVAELPFGKVIIGDVVDPSAAVRPE